MFTFRFASSLPFIHDPLEILDGSGSREGRRRIVIVVDEILEAELDGVPAQERVGYPDVLVIGIDRRDSYEVEGGAWKHYLRTDRFGDSVLIGGRVELVADALKLVFDHNDSRSGGELIVNSQVGERGGKSVGLVGLAVPLDESNHAALAHCRNRRRAHRVINVGGYGGPAPESSLLLCVRKRNR
jgi:hypothetical protein